MVGSSAVKQTPVNLVPFSLSGKLCFWKLMCYDFNLCDQKCPACSSPSPWENVNCSAASKSSPTQRQGTDQYFFLRTENGGIPGMIILTECWSQTPFSVLFLAQGEFSCLKHKKEGKRKQ